MLIRRYLSLFALTSLSFVNVSCAHDAPPPSFGAEGPGVTAAVPIDALPARATFAMRFGLKRLRGTALAEATPSLVRETPLSDRYDQWVRACHKTPLDTFDDVVVGLVDDGLLVAAELRIPPEEALRCVKESFGAREVRFQERQALRIDGAVPLFALASGKLLLVGDEASLADALDMAGRQRPLAACLDSDASGVWSGCGAPPKLGAVLRELRFKARSMSAGFSFDAQVGFAQTTGPAALRDRLAVAKKTLVKEQKFVRDALDTVRIELVRVVPNGADATINAASSGDEVAQAAYLLALATGVHRATWAEEARALATEARTNVAALAEALRKSAGKPRARGPVFPIAPPAVPDDVPRGVEHTPGAEDFSDPGWRELGFALKTPHRYQYEVVVSPNRRRATAVARGDLDGNGKTSLYEIVVDVVGTNVVVSPLKVADEFE